MVIAALSLVLAQVSAPLAEMDFELVNGHVYVPATVNGNATKAIIDSGAGMSVMDSALAQQWKLPSAGAMQANGIGSEAVKGQFLKDTLVSFGGVTQPMTIAIPLGPLTEAEGRPLGTVVGYELFLKNIVQIDYAHSKVRIYAGDSGYKPSGVATEMRVVGNHPHIKTMMEVGDKMYPLETMVDSGASTGGLTQKFLAANSIATPTTPRYVIGGGVGGFVEGRLFRPDWLQVSGMTAQKPLMTMTDSEGGASGAKSSYDYLLGSDILRRFTVTFDYANKRIFFEPNSELGKPFEADKTGLRLFAVAPDLRSFRIMGVLRGSSAEDAGLKENDVIESIDGKPAGQFELHQLRELFRSTTASGWELGIRRGDQTLKIKLKAKPVI